MTTKQSIPGIIYSGVIPYLIIHNYFRHFHTKFNSNLTCILFAYNIVDVVLALTRIIKSVVTGQALV